ncbi:MAG TPA: PPE domain-containing protein, partial [Lentzea sp.]
MAGDEPNITGFAVLPFAGGETVYKWFEKGKGPSQSTSPTAQAWRDLASGHTEVSRLIEQAVKDSGASWEGAAADQARGATSPLATWADVTGDSAKTAGTTSDTVGQAYVDAKYKMSKPPEVPDKPFLNDYKPWTTDYDKTVEQNQKVSEQNMEAFKTYGDAVMASTDSMPTFISPDPNDAGMVEEGNGKKPGRVDPPGTGDPYTPPGTGNPPPGTGNPPGSDGRTDLSGWKPPNNDTTNPSWLEPGAPTPGDPNDPRNRPNDPNDPRNRPPTDTGIPPGRWDPNNPNDPRNRGRLDPNDPRNRLGGPGGPGGGRGGGPGGGPGGGRGGIGGGPGGLGGAAAAKAGGPGGFGGAAGVAEGAGRGGAGGFGPGAAGAAGRGGAAGMGAGGMGGHGGKGQGEEDTEHKSA